MDEVPAIPDHELYTPRFSPWLARSEFLEDYEIAKPRTLVTVDRGYVLYTLGRQALALDGDFWDCGVYRGGSSILLKLLLDRFEPKGSRLLRLFDTFSGTPPAEPELDGHKEGDFHQTSVEAVREQMPSMVRVRLHPGVIPTTFKSFKGTTIALAHVDVDLHQSVKACCEFIHPRIIPGGFIVFDDYGFEKCLGARWAVDNYFEDKPEFPLVLSTGQAIVCKLAPES